MAVLCSGCAEVPGPGDRGIDKSVVPNFHLAGSDRVLHRIDMLVELCWLGVRQQSGNGLVWDARVPMQQSNIYRSRRADKSLSITPTSKQTSSQEYHVAKDCRANPSANAGNYRQQRPHTLNIQQLSTTTMNYLLYTAVCCCCLLPGI